jgi:hydrogenase expression/formation protein HypC
MCLGIPMTLLADGDMTARVLDAEEAEAIDRALEGVAAALDGRAFEHLFQDLIDREPTLPAHLRA